ncbi:class I SAM-dependent methyltransferase [Rhodococcoides corynebacterioides]|uniref:Class I SAM-dependent methyltransferase n=1 Tax=Rhodococcoides corynebacterioides TaxID=53972 RepID=A0ABS7P318_9NOCA|nr:class I SAM-dependent methyltransferase [Rhodococcus corynebacterioides]MBY6366773.1 class I SAM-dependent methyltransferase [Rhodococcus corynebacterioides]MBY6408467.1 class I SAM-dependent methyltransferase [Rhodococcus corynebacterioides]
MGYAFDLADVEYLTGAAEALAEVDGYALTPASLVGDLARVRARFGAHAPALVETVTVRRRARTKLAAAGSWLLTDDAVQQATPDAVSAHRARRLAGRAIHDVTCSIGTELHALRATAASVVGSDLDPVRLAMAAHNVPDVPVLRADALTPVTRGTVVIADPGRRAGGRRIRDPAALEPPLPHLLSAYAGRDLVVKCAPGLDFARLPDDAEIEVVSLDGAVREACLWIGGVADPAVRRRATVLRTGRPPTTVVDTDPDDIDDRAPGRYIVDPDGAVVRAGLVRHYAARHGLWQLDPRIAHLTGDRIPPDRSGFEILERLPMQEKQLRKDLARRDCGSLEILVRGVDVDPAVLRPRLALRGSTPLSLVITRIGRTAVAFVCGPRTVGDERTPPPGSIRQARSIQ